MTGVIFLTPAECANAGDKLPAGAREGDLFLMAERRNDGKVGSVVVVGMLKADKRDLFARPVLFAAPIVEALGALVVDLSERVAALEDAAGTSQNGDAKNDAKSGARPS